MLVRILIWFIMIPAALGSKYSRNNITSQNFFVARLGSPRCLPVTTNIIAFSLVANPYEPLVSTEWLDPIYSILTPAKHFWKTFHNAKSNKLAKKNNKYYRQRWTPMVESTNSTQTSSEEEQTIFQGTGGLLLRRVTAGGCFSSQNGDFPLPC